MAGRLRANQRWQPDVGDRAVRSSEVLRELGQRAPESVRRKEQALASYDRPGRAARRSVRRAAPA
jgi:hypothetical protein